METDRKWFDVLCRKTSARSGDDTRFGTGLPERLSRIRSLILYSTWLFLSHFHFHRLLQVIHRSKTKSEKVGAVKCWQVLKPPFAIKGNYSNKFLITPIASAADVKPTNQRSRIWTGQCATVQLAQWAIFDFSDWHRKNRDALQKIVFSGTGANFAKNRDKYG